MYFKAFGKFQLDSGINISISVFCVGCCTFMAFRRASIICLRAASLCFLIASVAALVGLGVDGIFLSFF